MLYLLYLLASKPQALRNVNYQLVLGLHFRKLKFKHYLALKLNIS